MQVQTADGRLLVWDGALWVEAKPVVAQTAPAVADARELPRNFDARPPRDYAERLLGMVNHDR
jgi:hypothetical protein